MKLRTLALGILLLVSSAKAQTTLAGRFLGNIAGYGDIYVESFSQVSANIYFFDLRNGIMEYATVQLLNGSGAGTSALNFRVVLTLNESAATGTWGGLPFNAARQSPLGAAGTKVFTGATVQTATATVAQVKLSLLPNNRVIMTALSQGRLIVGGTGTRERNNHAVDDIGNSGGFRIQSRFGSRARDRRSDRINAGSVRTCGGAATGSREHRDSRNRWRSKPAERRLRLRERSEDLPDQGSRTYLGGLRRGGRTERSEADGFLGTDRDRHKRLLGIGHVFS